MPRGWHCAEAQPRAQRPARKCGAAVRRGARTGRGEPRAPRLRAQPTARARTAQVQPVSLLLCEGHALVVLWVSQQLDAADNGAHPGNGRGCAALRVLAVRPSRRLAPAVAQPAGRRNATAGATLRRGRGGAGAECPRAATPRGGHRAPHGGAFRTQPRAPAARAAQEHAAATRRGNGARVAVRKAKPSQRGRGSPDRAMPQLLRALPTLFWAAGGLGSRVSRRQASRACRGRARRARRSPDALPPSRALTAHHVEPPQRACRLARVARRARRALPAAKRAAGCERRDGS